MISKQGFGSRPMLWLGIHLPQLPLEIFLLGQTGALDPAEPNVVVERNRIRFRNAAAGAAGLVTGTTLATAQSIVPALRYRVRQPDREARRLRLLAETLYRFSSHVSLAPPAGIVLEIGGSLRLFGDAAELARQVVALCRELGHEVRCRWARTPLAALVLAAAGRTAGDLDAVPLSCAAVEPEPFTAQYLERLANMGLHTLGQLLALPERTLARRFGTVLTTYLQRLTGARPDPRLLLQPSPHFHGQLHLLEPLHSKGALAGPMESLLNDLQHWLIGRQLGTAQLRWHFAAADGQRRVSLPVGFAAAEQSSAALLGITRLKLEQATLPDDLISLGLEARRLTPWRAANGRLFAGLPDADGGWQTGERSADPARLVAELQARLGDRACSGIELLDQHAPEHAWGPVRPLAQAASTRGAVAGGNADAAAVRARRPLWLFTPPRPTSPAALTLLRGPERIQVGWWLTESRSPDAGAVQPQSRDYYVARHHCGAECWVFVDAAQRWYLHGYFG